jgi:CRP-like cAMP-binding protein
MLKNPACSRCPARTEGVFASAAPARLERLMSERIAREYAPGETICHEGTPSLAVHCVASGHIKMSTCGPHGDYRVVAMRGPGDLLGCRAVLAGCPYMASAETLQASLVCTIPRSSFMEALREDAGLAFAVLTHMARQTTAAEAQLVSRSTDHVRKRTARYLLSLAPCAPGAERIALGPLLPRHEMALLIGTTAETLSRTIHRLAEEGVISVARDRITVLDLAALRNVAR